MKSEKLFKILIDAIFILQLLGISSAIFIIPSGAIIKINMQNQPVEEWSLFHWLILVISFLAYIIFVVGIFYLKKISKGLVDRKYFTILMIKNLQKVGKMFIVSGSFMIGIFLIQFISNLTNKTIRLIYNTELLFSVFIVAIGLFFLIQSKILEVGKNLKQENELTI